MVFVSGKIACEDMIFTQSDADKIRNKLTQLKNPKDNNFIENQIIKKRKEKEINETYSEASGFEEFIKNLQETIKSIFIEKIENPIITNLVHLEDRVKYLKNIYEHLKDNSEGFLRKNIMNKNIETKFSEFLSENEKNFNKIKDVSMIQFKIHYEEYSKNKENLKEKYYEFVKSCEVSIRKINLDIIESYRQFITKILILFKPVPKTSEFFEGSFKFIVDNIARTKSKRNDEILYSFLPDNIDYHRIWIIHKISSIFTTKNTFEQKIKVFFNEFNDKLEKNIIVKLNQDYNKEFQTEIKNLCLDTIKLLKNLHS